MVGELRRVHVRSVACRVMPVQEDTPAHAHARRGVAVPLVNAFAIPDHILRSPIGLAGTGVSDMYKVGAQGRTCVQGAWEDARTPCVRACMCVRVPAPGCTSAGAVRDPVGDRCARTQEYLLAAGFDV